MVLDIYNSVYLYEILGDIMEHMTLFIYVNKNSMCIKIYTLHKIACKQKNLIHFIRVVANDQGNKIGKRNKGNK